MEFYLASKSDVDLYMLILKDLQIILVIEEKSY